MPKLKNDRIFDCLIIGAGQAGLAAGRLAQGAGLDFIILERGNAAGAEWQRRAPDQTLFTPRAMSQLPGLLMDEGAASGYPTNAEMARYFARYANTFDLPIQTECNVIGISRSADLFDVKLADDSVMSAHNLILANGANQTPLVPAKLAEPIRHCTTQTTARDFWTSAPSPDARVLIVGDGASGRQTALDFAARGHQTILSGVGRRLTPARILGHSLFKWLTIARLLHADRDTARAGLLRKLNPVPSKKALGDTALKKAGITLRPKLIETTAAINGKGTACGQASFADGTSQQFDHVVWCVGYIETSPFNQFAQGKSDGWYTEGRGLTEIPGLFVTGRCWLTSRASELILGAPRDAERIMSAVLSNLSCRPLEESGIHSTPALKEQHHA